MGRSEFSDGVEALKGKKIVVIVVVLKVLTKGLNLRDSGLTFLNTLACCCGLPEKRQSWKNGD